MTNTQTHNIFITASKRQKTGRKHNRQASYHSNKKDTIIRPGVTESYQTLFEIL